MIYIAIFGLLILLLLFWILFARLIFYVDTVTSEYYVSFGNQIKMDLFFMDGFPMLRAKIFFIQKEIDPLEPNTKKKKKKKEKKEKDKKEKTKKREIVDKPGLAKTAIRQIKKIIKTFNVKKFHLNIDTNDFIYNSYLAGLFSAINRGNLLLQTNYTGDFFLKINIQNRIVNILMPLISSIFLLKKHFVKIKQGENYEHQH